MRDFNFKAGCACSTRKGEWEKYGSLLDGNQWTPNHANGVTEEDVIYHGHFSDVIAIFSNSEKKTITRDFNGIRAV